MVERIPPPRPATTTDPYIIPWWYVSAGIIANVAACSKTLLHYKRSRAKRVTHNIWGEKEDTESVSILTWQYFVYLVFSFLNKVARFQLYANVEQATQHFPEREAPIPECIARLPT